MNSPDFPIHLSGYFDYLIKVKKLADGSIRDTKCTFVRLMRFQINQKVETQIYELELAFFIDWMNEMRADQLSPKSIAKMISHVRSYLDYCWRTGRGRKNVLDGFFVKDAYKKVAPPILTIDEVTILVKSLPQETDHQRMKRLIILMLYGLGLRTGELCSLNCSDINHERQQIIVRKGKGGIQRVLPIPDGVWIELLLYLKKKKSQGALFLTAVKKKRVDVSYIGSIMSEAMENSGLGFEATPKTLRHTFASHLMDRGVSIAVISSLMGHVSPSETGVYLHSFKARREESMAIIHSKLDEEEET